MAERSRKPYAGVPGEWIMLKHDYLNGDNIAFIEERNASLIVVHMIRDRADRQRLPVRNTKAWTRRTLKVHLLGEDAEAVRKWVRSRGVLLVLPQAKDPDEF